MKDEGAEFVSIARISDAPLKPLGNACSRLQIPGQPTKLVFAINLAMVAAIIIMTGCSQEHQEYIEGRGQAERDLAHGEFKVAIADGSNIPAFAEYAELLHQRYRIRWFIYSLPANPRAAEARVRGYNEVASPRIEREIGAQVLKQTMADAQKLHDAATAKNVR